MRPELFSKQNNQLATILEKALDKLNPKKSRPINLKVIFKDNFGGPSRTEAEHPQPRFGQVGLNWHGCHEGTWHKSMRSGGRFFFCYFAVMKDQWSSMSAMPTSTGNPDSPSSHVRLDLPACSR